MLEVLDPQQNKTFYDNYIGVPFDLSQAIFIATANDLGKISAPLRDRMEVIELAGYTAEEKYKIAKKYGMNLNYLLTLNGLSTRSKIYPGQQLWVTNNSNQ